MSCGGCCRPTGPAAPWALVCSSRRTRRQPPTLGLGHTQPPSARWHVAPWIACASARCFVIPASSAVGPSAPLPLVSTSPTRWRKPAFRCFLMRPECRSCCGSCHPESARTLLSAGYCVSTMTKSFRIRYPNDGPLASGIHPGQQTDVGLTYKPWYSTRPIRRRRYRVLARLTVPELRSRQGCGLGGSFN